MKTTVQQTSETDTWQAEAHKQASAATILQTYKDKTAQRYASDDDELLQGKFEMMASSTEQQDTVQRKVNNTGLPDSLKNGIENLSGYSMDDVKVHYNSSQPATLQAHAYAQGTDIHIAPGQEKHLPHEAWHVVQQKQGRVKPTMQMKGNVPVNDNEGLEKEADSMGNKALNMNKKTSLLNQNLSSVNPNKQSTQLANDKRRKKQEKKHKAKELEDGRQGGVIRNQQYNANWVQRNWREHIKSLKRKILNQQRTPTGKTIFNLTNGEQIVIDQGGQYWRHFDGNNQYFDADGNAHPNQANFHEKTHFLI